MDKYVDITILCITYNHAKYIRKTLDGFFMQKGDFTYKIIVHDDASNDGTQTILKEYKEKYPDKVELILQNENQYSKKNGRITEKFLFPIVNSKYVAVCEGDDYWIYDKKLQKQYEWMESHPNATLCVHNAIRYNESTQEVIPQIMDMNTGNMSDEEIFWSTSGAIPTASYFLKSQYIKQYPDYIKKCPVGDEPLRWWLAYNGDIYYMDKVWSVRNYMHKGSWNYRISTDIEFEKQYIKKYIQSLIEFEKETEYRYHPYVERKIFLQCNREINLTQTNTLLMDELKDKVEECKKNNIEEVASYYDNAFFVSARKCIDYYYRVFGIAKKYKDKFYIYGAGLEAKKNAEVLVNNNIDFSGFVVTQKVDARTELFNHNIFEFNEIANKNDCFFWLCMNYDNSIEVMKMLREQGIDMFI